MNGYSLRFVKMTKDVESHATANRLIPCFYYPGGHAIGRPPRR